MGFEPLQHIPHDLTLGSSLWDRLDSSASSVPPAARLADSHHDRQVGGLHSQGREIDADFGKLANGYGQISTDAKPIKRVFCFQRRHDSGVSTAENQDQD